MQYAQRIPMAICFYMDHESKAALYARIQNMDYCLKIVDVFRVSSHHQIVVMQEK